MRKVAKNANHAIAGLLGMVMTAFLVLLVFLLVGSAPVQAASDPANQGNSKGREITKKPAQKKVAPLGP